MKREFKWDFKENMTQEEFNAVLEQHYKFMGVDKFDAMKKELADATALNTSLQESLDKANAELQPVKEEALQKRYSNLLPKNANKELMKDIIALSAVQDDMEDDAIKEAFKNTIKSRDYLQTKVSTTEPKVESQSIFGKSEAKPEEAGASKIFD